jgi:hypothetical protein
MTVVLPTPHEPLVNRDGKINEIWYRYFAQSAIATNAASSAVTALSTAINYATQAQQEAGASSIAIVTSSVQKFHPSAAKAWGKASVSTVPTATLNAGYNVASVTVGASGGMLVVELTVPFSSSNYSVTANQVVTGTSQVEALGVAAFATTGFTLFNESGSDPIGYTFSAYGDQ